MKTLLCVACVCLLSFASTFSQAINEGFSNVAGLTPAGWNQQNLSTPIGVNPNWVQGDPINMPFSANSLPANSYIAVNYNSVAGAATISNWLITPMLNLSNGDVITFYTRGTGSIYADNLQVRLSTNGSSANVGASNISVGDFSNLLLEINPTLNAALYPATWSQYTITISGLATPTTGRIAFRYYVPNGGPTGSNSDLIGIDDFVYTPVPSCNLTATASAINAMGGAPNGAVTTSVANGTAPYTYLWSSGQVSQNLSGLAPGNYSVTVTDAAGCTASASSNVINVAGPTVLSNSNVVSSYQVVNGGFTPQWVCPNDTLYTDGGIMNIYLESGATMITGGGIDTIYAKTGATIVMSGGIHVIYHEPSVNLVMNGGIPTLYPCPSLVFNYSQAPANGCVPVPVCNLSASLTTNNIDCYGAASGSVTASITGGTGPYIYLWNNGSITQTISNLPVGCYTVTITDVNGCVVSQTACITEAPIFSAIATIVNPILCNGNSATVIVAATGGTSPYSGTGTFTVPAGNYNYLVSDANGCNSNVNITLSTPTAITLTTISTDEIVGNDGTATVTASGGTAPYSYSWSNGATAQNLSSLAAGSYTVTITDANGCTESTQVQVGSQVGLNEHGSSDIISIYPNPATEQLYISSLEENNIIEIEIYSIDGQLLTTLVAINESLVCLNMQDWSAGIYTVRIKSSTGYCSKRFVKS